MWVGVDLGRRQAVALGCGCEVSLETKCWVPVASVGTMRAPSSGLYQGSPTCPCPICTGTNVMLLIERSKAYL